MTDTLNLDAIAKVLAVELTARTGETFRAVIEAERNPNIESPRACFHLCEDWRTHRLMINATVPNGMREKKTAERMTVDPRRTAEAIARDIETRLLTHAREHLKESAEYDRERKQEIAEKNLRLNFLRKYLPREYQPDKLCNATSMRTANIYAQITYDNLIELEIRLPLKQALQILEIMKGL